MSSARVPDPSHEVRCSRGGGLGDFIPDASAELRLDALLRRHHLVLPLTLATAALLYAGVLGCGFLYKTGVWAAVFPAAVLAHAFMIVTIHDGAHRSITGTAADLLIANLGAGLLLLPFYAEPFRDAHLAHHRHTNCAHDPLWPNFKEGLFHRSRILYMLGECLPLVFTVLALSRRRDSGDAHAPHTAARRTQRRRTARTWVNLALSFAVAAAVFLVVPPAPGFFIGTVLLMGVLSSLRHWCEHTGTEPERESNTFRFPLGMGVGNHRVHHLHPRISWLALALALWSREKETGPLSCLWSMLRDPRHVHYRGRRER